MAGYAGFSDHSDEQLTPQPRKRLVSTEVTPFYHAIARCVRRHFLCVIDPLTGEDYSARKQVSDRISLLADVFAIDVCAYAILLNHDHLILHIDEQAALALSDTEVAERWIRVFTGPVLVRAFFAGQKLTDIQENVVQNYIKDYRKRLCSLSWFMKYLNEPIARQANTEDNVTGHFWQARFLREPLNNSAQARRSLCGRFRVGLGERGLVIPNERVQTSRRPRKGPSRRVSPEKPHLARCATRP
jgi:hypothetical protein